MSKYVFVVDGWDEATGTAFCKVFACEGCAEEKADELRREYEPKIETGSDGQPDLTSVTYLAVGVRRAKVRRCKA